VSTLVFAGAELVKLYCLPSGRKPVSLIVLVTRVGGVTEQLYRKLGYLAAGSIPAYTRSKNGEPHDTLFFYKNL
jgi:hypothetical protein